MRHKECAEEAQMSETEHVPCPLRGRKVEVNQRLSLQKETRQKEQKEVQKKQGC